MVRTKKIGNKKNKSENSSPTRLSNESFSVWSVIKNVCFVLGPFAVILTYCHSVSREDVFQEEGRKKELAVRLERVKKSLNLIELFEVSVSHDGSDQSNKTIKVLGSGVSSKERIKNVDEFFLAVVDHTQRWSQIRDAIGYEKLNLEDIADQETVVEWMGIHMVEKHPKAKGLIEARNDLNNILVPVSTDNRAQEDVKKLEARYEEVLECLRASGPGSIDKCLKDFNFVVPPHLKR